MSVGGFVGGRGGKRGEAAPHLDGGGGALAEGATHLPLRRVPRRGRAGAGGAAPPGGRDDSGPRAPGHRPSVERGGGEALPRGVSVSKPAHSLDVPTG